MVALSAIALSTITSAITPVIGLSQTIPAFSGADGAARNVTGGRGGIVYHVTKLNSAINDPARNDPGTIRYGLNNANFPANTPRTIVFDVGGVFHLGQLATANYNTNGNGWDAQSRLTIGGTSVTLAGQTAPGVGVIFMGGGLKPQGNNNIIRNITMASGYGHTGWWKSGDPFPQTPGTPGAGADASKWYPDNVVYDAMDIAGTNIMIDHVSTLYATDETISMNEVANNITVQYSNISQGQNYPQWDAEGGGLTGHALGSLLSAGNTTSQAAISFHHNLYAHQKGRVPQTQSISGSLGAFYDFRNNVFYNWMGTAGSKSGTTSWNLVNNFYLAGAGGDNPIGGSTPGWTNASGGTGVISASTTLYRNGNLLDSNKDGDALDGATLAAGGAASPLWMGGVSTYVGVTDSAATAYARVLDYVGARWWTRDATIDTPDERIINEARTGTGKIIAWADDPFNSDPAEGTEWRALLNYLPDANGNAPFTRPANFDTDQDGMPNTWEAVHGLNPDVADNNGDFDTDGYTNLEEYLNELAEWPAPNALTFVGANNRYAEINNWHLSAASAATATDVWQPSKYDTAQINSGTIVVDSVGQHAGTLQVGTTGSAATLSVTGGWIEVATSLQIGATGTLNISSGGTVFTYGISANTASTNNGLLSVVSGGAMNSVSGAGIIALQGGTLSTGSLSQGSVIVNAGATMNATSFNLTSSATNDGTINTTLGGTIAGLNGAGTFNVSGGNLTSAGAIVQNLLVIGSGRTVSINANGGSGSVSKLKALSLVSDGAGGYLSTLQLHDNDLVLDYSGSVSLYETAVNHVKKGIVLLGGNGKGIASAEVDAQTLPGTMLGVVDNGAIGGAITSLSGFASVPVDSVLVKYTWFGDSNLDGVVDASDYALIDTGFTSGGTLGGWVFGDLDYSGTIDSSDYALIDTGFISQSGVLPEPGAIGLVGLGALFLKRRRMICR